MYVQRFRLPSKLVLAAIQYFVFASRQGARGVQERFGE